MLTARKSSSTISWLITIISSVIATPPRRLDKSARFILLSVILLPVVTVQAQSADGFNPGADNTVNAIAVQADGKIIVGGSFLMLGGGTGAAQRSYLGRLNADGTLDTSFNPGPDGPVSSITVQPDGKILVGGSFFLMGVGTPNITFRRSIARLNADGTLDTAFHPGVNQSTGVLALQADGKILVGGEFTLLGGGGMGTTPRSKIGRLNADGTLDTSFDPGADTGVFSIAVQPDGKILVGGSFQRIGGGGTGTTPRNHIARLNADGTVDTTFNPGANHFISSFVVQPDGKILVGGAFGMLGGGGTGMTPRSFIGRLNVDGTVDTSFNPGADGSVLSLGLQADGKILASGFFFNIAGQPRRYIARLDADGTLDMSFDPNPSHTILPMMLQADGKILVGGEFTSIGGQPRNRIARLTNNIAAFQNLTVSTSTITWWRGGASPELSRVTFERSNDGINYTLLGAGLRLGTSSNWHLTGQALPPGQNLYVRARGYYSGGVENNSGSVVESVRNIYLAPPLFDFDGDGKSDISLFRPDNGVWYLLNSSTGFTASQFGLSSDKIVPADYDGDSKTDLAVYRSGTWYLQRSLLGFTDAAFGNASDIPMPADYDGDGKAELAVYRPSNATWYVLNLANGQFTAVQFGSSTDKPVAADYDGDGKADYAVYRPAEGVWYLLRSTQGFTSIQFGLSTDKPVVGDYDGDGKADPAVYRPSDGSWYLLRSTEGFAGVQFGIATDLPAPADYDGDGKTDLAVFRDGNWYQLKSTQGFAGVQFGAINDRPIPNAFVP